MQLTKQTKGFHLIGKTGAFQDRVFNLSKEFSLGRSPTSSLFVPDVMVSRNHARIYKTENSFFLEDLRSQNGTFLNGKRIYTAIRLKNGDIVKIGNSEFLFTEPESEETSDKELALDTLKENFLVTKEVSSVQIEDIKVFEKRTFLALLRIGEVLQSTHDMEHILQTVLKEIIEYTDADAGFVFTPSEKKDSFVVSASAVSSARSDDTLMKTVKPSKTLLKWVVKNRSAVISRNIADDMRFATSDSIIAMNLCSILSIPAIKEDKVLGALQLMNLDPVKNFTEKDLEFTTLVARLLAVSIDNSVLHTEKDETIKTLKEVQAVLVNTQNELIEKEKMAVIGKLSAGIVHEVKNLLGPVVMSDLLKESYPEDPFINQYVQTLGESYSQILSLMNEK
ncbi:MAG: FHA domain-containing protein [Deltaproteobacteria bacterium]|nr:FHA domain-containing protein [Deltaproteobacteria bacterium]